jgi:hypothetical protein
MLRAAGRQASRIEGRGQLRYSAEAPLDALFQHRGRHATIFGQDRQEFDQAHGVEYVGEASAGRIGSNQPNAKVFLHDAEPTEQMCYPNFPLVRHGRQACG